MRAARSSSAPTEPGDADRAAAAAADAPRTGIRGKLSAGALSSSGARASAKVCVAASVPAARRRALSASSSLWSPAFARRSRLRSRTRLGFLAAGIGILSHAACSLIVHYITSRAKNKKSLEPICYSLRAEKASSGGSGVAQRPSATAERPQRKLAGRLASYLSRARARYRRKFQISRNATQRRQ